MTIVLVTDSYPPEIRSASHLMQELAEKLALRGHKVFVVTSHPGYNLAESVDVSGLEEYSSENDVNVLRVKTLPHHLVGSIIRGIAQLTMPHLLLRKMKQYIKEKADVVIVYSPPVTLARVGAVLKKQYNARFLLNVQDIFPQNAIDLGVLRNKRLIRFFENIEKKAYAAADEILVHSEGNREFLLSRKNLKPSKVHIVHNWIDVSAYAETVRTGKFRQKYGLSDKFVFLFAGVMGPSQGLNLVVEAADRVRANTDISFLFAGDGVEKPKLRETVKRRGLKNVIFSPFVAKDEYPQLLKDVDVGLVSLTSKNKTPVVPGKILGYMAAGIPVLALLQKQSDAHKLISTAGCGYSAEHGDSASAAALITQMFEQRSSLKQLGANGTKYVSQAFSLEKTIGKIESLF